MDKKKIVLLGRPAAGKTTIEKVFFEGANPAVLIDKPLPPTVGLSTVAVPWLDTTVSIFDYPGQNMARVLDDEAKFMMILEQAFVVVYAIDCTRWEAERPDIQVDVDAIRAVTRKNGVEVELVLFCHKIDLLGEHELDGTRAAVKAWAGLQAVPLHFTSIAPGFLHLLYDAFYAVLGAASGEARQTKEILDKNLRDCKRTLCFISDARNAVLALASTADFAFPLLHPLPGFFSSVVAQFESIKADDKVDHVIISTRQRTRVDFRSLEPFTGRDRRLIIVSDDLNPVAIHRLSDAITGDFKAAFGTR
ncbi:MAG: GTPase domain-containing protein [Candidatus Lokiarchaeota archaeon]|nr:GTPase domain-containing protein [Candidatus Lokiarchaeota archaeon]